MYMMAGRANRPMTWERTVERRPPREAGRSGVRENDARVREGAKEGTEGRNRRVYRAGVAAFRQRGEVMGMKGDKEGDERNARREGVREVGGMGVSSSDRGGGDSKCDRGGGGLLPWGTRTGGEYAGGGAGVGAVVGHLGFEAERRGPEPETKAGAGIAGEGDVETGRGAVGRVEGVTSEAGERRAGTSAGTTWGGMVWRDGSQGKASKQKLLGKRGVGGHRVATTYGMAGGGEGMKRGVLVGERRYGRGTMRGGEDVGDAGSLDGERQGRRECNGVVNRVTGAGGGWDMGGAGKRCTLESGGRGGADREPADGLSSGGRGRGGGIRRRSRTGAGGPGSRPWGRDAKEEESYEGVRVGRNDGGDGGKRDGGEAWEGGGTGDGA
ncbi:hypothetical protein Tco_0733961 [Tanacetum coccineum]|uniref:Uncharacterized protein n=1 Tax=Tanacetum coccineum TaxID=301880 RepID=A0ABQ5G883_9ASTR